MSAGPDDRRATTVCSAGPRPEPHTQHLCPGMQESPHVALPWPHGMVPQSSVSGGPWPVLFFAKPWPLLTCDPRNIQGGPPEGHPPPTLSCFRPGCVVTSDSVTGAGPAPEPM